MKHTLLLSLLMLLCGARVCSQQRQEVMVPDNVNRCELMSDCKHLLMYTHTPLGKQEYIIMRDIDTGKNLWKMNVADLNVYTSIVAPELLMMVSYENPKKPYTSFINTLTGKEVYHLDFCPQYHDTEADIMIGYKTPKSKEAECRRISTGELLWTAKIAPNKGAIWNQCRKLGPRSVAAIADDFCVVDYDGGFVSQPLKTDIEYVSKTAAGGAAIASAVGVLGAIFGGYGMIAMPVGQALAGIHSNILYDDSRIYVSDRKSLYCYDTKLNTMWQHDFPAKTATHAYLYFCNDTLVMVNQGYGVYGDMKVDAGPKFIATFDKATGQQIEQQKLGKWDENRFGETLSMQYDTVYRLTPDSTRFEPIYRPALTMAAYDVDDNLIIADADDQQLGEYHCDDIYEKYEVDTERFGLIVHTVPAAPDEIYVVDSQQKVIDKICDPVRTIDVVNDRLVLLTWTKLIIISY